MLKKLCFVFVSILFSYSAFGEVVGISITDVRSTPPSSKTGPDCRSGFDSISRKSDDAEIAGDRRAIRTIQRQIVDLGYKPGPIDGVIGSRTRSAIRCFEESAGIEKTGAITENPDLSILPKNSPIFWTVYLSHRVLTNLTHQPLTHWGLRPKTG